MPEATMSPFLRRSTNSGMPSKAATSSVPSRWPALIARKRAKSRLVCLDEHGLHVRVGGQHVLRELEGLVGGIGLHLLQARLLREARRLHGVAETRGAGLAVLARLRDGDKTDRAVSPALVLARPDSCRR